MLYRTNPVGVQLFSHVNTFFCHVKLLHQTNPVGVQFFSYVSTFFCHVVVPNQSCGSSTLFLCKNLLLLQYICMTAGHVSEYTLQTYLIISLHYMYTKHTPEGRGSHFHTFWPVFVPHDLNSASLLVEIRK